MVGYLCTSLYEQRHRAEQLGITAFACTFAIMTFAWGTEYDPDVGGYFNLYAILFSMPILALATIALIATVVIDKHRWTWPFWACWLFIYIFNHSLNASSYVKDVSKLDIFAWFNMSVIVFIFLFAIPVYFMAGARAPLTSPGPRP